MQDKTTFTREEINQRVIELKSSMGFGGDTISPMDAASEIGFNAKRFTTGEGNLLDLLASAVIAEQMIHAMLKHEDEKASQVRQILTSSNHATIAKA